MKKVFVPLFIIFSSLVISACETIKFTSETLPILPPKKIISVVEKTEVDKNPEVKIYKHGRFLVEVYPDKDIIYGGIFKPELPMPFESDESKFRHVIFINYYTKELSYFRLNENKYESILGYAVMSPSASFLPKDIVRGVVKKIDTKPNWCPTINIRRKYPYLPAGCLPFGHELNAMGVAKFEIDWDTPNWDFIRLHGTGGYAEGNFWDEETFGCTRLKNELMHELLNELGDLEKAVKEGIEVIVFR